MDDGEGERLGIAGWAMKPTQEQVIAWAREVGLISEAASKSIYDGFTETFVDGYLLEAAYTAAYEAGRKDENEACAKACEHFISSKENNDAWTITRDLALQAAADVIRARREQ